jgi:hypothetical protein
LNRQARKNLNRVTDTKLIESMQMKRGDSKPMPMAGGLLIYAYGWKK